MNNQLNRKNMTNDEKMKRRGEMFRSLPVSDWHQIIAFEKIIRNYIKMKELLEQTKNG